MKGNIVLTVGCFGHADKDVYLLTSEEKRALDKLHLDKIVLSDEVLIIDVNGYIGESTQNELNHARALSKRIRFWSKRG